MKTLIICLAMVASASSLAAWGNQNNRDYQEGMNESIPYYQGGHVSEQNYDNQAMGPYYNNNNRYNYNRTPSNTNQSSNNNYNNSSSSYNSNSNNYNNSNSNPNNNQNASRPGQMMSGSTSYISLNDASTNVGDKVRRAIQKDTALSSNARAALVTADGNGVVTISGTVASDAEKAKLESLVKSVEGVKSVKNNVSVQSHK